MQNRLILEWKDSMPKPETLCFHGERRSSRVNSVGDGYATCTSLSMAVYICAMFHSTDFELNINKISYRKSNFNVAQKEMRSHELEGVLHHGCVRVCTHA